MRRATAWFVALSLPVLFLLGGSAAAQKKTDKDADKAAEKKKADKDSDKPADKWIKSGEITGKITNVYEDKRKLRVQLVLAATKLNAGALQQIQQAQISYAQAAARRDVNGMIQAQRQMAQAQGNLYTVDKQTRDIEIQALDDVVVRNAQPKQEFDDKGRVKKLTRAELKEQKGDPKLPGYKAEFGDLQTEMIVKFTIVRKKGTPIVKRPVKKGKDKDADEGVDALVEDLPQASMIMILYTPPVGK